MRAILGKLLRGLGYVLLAICASVTLLALPSGMVEWRYVGQFIFAFIGGPILAILLVGMFLAILRWHRTRDRLAIVMSIIAASGVAASVITFSGYFSAARAYQVSIALPDLFWPRPTKGTGPEPETYVYDRFENEDVKLIVYPKAPAVVAKNAPILVYIHGGGWVMGSADGRDADMRWFTEQGYLVIGVNYSLSSPERHLWDVTQPQIGCALSWIGTNATRLGGNPEKIVLFGESAGGNLVLNASGLAHRGRLPSRCGGNVPDIAATISIYPPVDLVPLYEHAPARRFGDAYLGGSPQEFPERYPPLSPITYVREKAPPVLILTGLEDSLVPVDYTLRYVDTARSAGRRVDLITIPRAGHGFDAIPGSAGNQIVRNATIAFLKREELSP